MELNSGTATPRSSSRSRRSTTNLSNLRLAPLSARFVEPQSPSTGARSPYEEAVEDTFARHTYRVGRSAPPTPGILSRSSSRRHLGGGLSRRGSLYEDASEAVFEYASVRQADAPGKERAEGGSGRMPKAKSEAALALKQRLSGHGVPLKRQGHGKSRTGGSNTPRAKSRKQSIEDEDWLTRTGAATNALLQESKGQTWLNSRDSSVSLVMQDDDDEGYEEMAALSASTAKMKLPDDGNMSPTTSKQGKWGSRFGSRSVSRRTSRRGSMTGLRTPLTAVDAPGSSYFDHVAHASPVDQAVAEDSAEDDTQDEAEAELSRMRNARTFGMGGIVDRLMGFNLFKAPEVESSEGEYGYDTEMQSDGEASQRRKAEFKRRREEQDRLVIAPPAPLTSEEGEKVGVWEDAAWLLSVAARAIS